MPRQQNATFPLARRENMVKKSQKKTLLARNVRKAGQALTAPPSVRLATKESMLVAQATNARIVRVASSNLRAQIPASDANGARRAIYNAAKARAPVSI